MKKRSGKEIAKKLLKNGFEKYHMKGNHLVMKKNDLFIHIPMYKVVKGNTLKNIEKRTETVI